MARDVRDHAQDITTISHLRLTSPFLNLLPMPPALMKTNMTTAEMIPDPAHNPQFWCLPPVRDRPSSVGRYPMYLVSQGRQVGVWHNWYVGCLALGAWHR
jgi:hypothetical protein